MPKFWSLISKRLQWSRLKKTLSHPRRSDPCLPAKSEMIKRCFWLGPFTWKWFLKTLFCLSLSLSLSTCGFGDHESWSQLSEHRRFLITNIVHRKVWDHRYTTMQVVLHGNTAWKEGQHRNTANFRVSHYVLGEFVLNYAFLCVSGTSWPRDSDDRERGSDLNEGQKELQIPTIIVLSFLFPNFFNGQRQCHNGMIEEGRRWHGWRDMGANWNQYPFQPMRDAMTPEKLYVSCIIGWTLNTIVSFQSFRFLGAARYGQLRNQPIPFTWSQDLRSSSTCQKWCWSRLLLLIPDPRALIRDPRILIPDPTPVLLMMSCRPWEEEVEGCQLESWDRKVSDPVRQPGGRFHLCQSMMNSWLPVRPPEGKVFFGMKTRRAGAVSFRDSRVTNQEAELRLE